MNSSKSEMNRRKFLKVGVATTAIVTAPKVKAKSYTSHKNNVSPKRKTLSNPFSDLKDDYEYLIIGSGYGGSVAAARLSEKYDVCLLERGKEWSPGEFPDKLGEMTSNMFGKSNPTGLYNFDALGDINVFSASGLGGTSLINASIIIEPDPRVFKGKRWPKEILSEYDSREIPKLYEEVKYMLQGERFPKNRPLPKKAILHQRSTEKLGLNFERANLTVNYSKTKSTKNHMGVIQNTCSLCGDCMSGCNYGAKNSLDVNYLPKAKSNGTEIFTGMTVTHVEKIDEYDYKVHFEYRLPNTKKIHKKGFIKAKNVIFAAGTIGTNKLLHQSKKLGLPVSNKLGHGFSGNADYLILGYNGKNESNIIGKGSDAPTLEKRKVGPTIVGIAHHNKSKKLKDHFLIEEGAVPRALTGLLMSVIHNITFKESINPKNWFRILKDVFHIGDKGAFNHSMLYLGMGHDDSNGQILRKKNGDVKIKWKDLEEQKVFKRMQKAVDDHCNELDSSMTKIPSPTMTTVHPLGGASMGDNPRVGVTNHLGQIFNPSSGKRRVHKGLYVTDASLIPTALGVNPLLTISMLAERVVRNID